MIYKVEKYIATHNLISDRGKVLVALSGGADSVALLVALCKLGYDCEAIHCNFHLRAEESNRDEEFVKELCSRRRVKLHIVHFDTGKYARDNKVSIEMAARELRYKWFDEIAHSEKCQAIVVAHHQNDQAETLLLNLRRGTGLRGLIGMRPISANPLVPDSTIPIVRPLLCTTRDYIEYYLRYKRHMEWVDDSTNADTTITRNAIREQLRSYSKAEIEHMAQTAEYMQGYLDIVEQRDTREAALVRLYEELRPYGFAEIEKIYDALQRGEGGKTFFSKTHKATIKHRKLCVTLV